MDRIYKKYYIKPVLALAVIWTFFLFFIFSWFNADSQIYNVGPSESNFLKINTWGKWSLVISYSFFSQIINSLVNATLYPFMTNVIKDHKTPWEGAYGHVYFIVIVYKLYYWVHGICEIFLVLTLEFQYYLPALIADVAVGILMTRSYLADKLSTR